MDAQVPRRFSFIFIKAEDGTLENLTDKVDVGESSVRSHEFRFVLLFAVKDEIRHIRRHLRLELDRYQPLCTVYSFQVSLEAFQRFGLPILVQRETKDPVTSLLQRSITLLLCRRYSVGQ